LTRTSLRNLGRQQVVYLGTGLALAGIGAGAAAGFAPSSAPSARPRPAAQASAASQRKPAHHVSARHASPRHVTATFAIKISRDRVTAHHVARPAHPHTWLAIERVIAGRPANAHTALPAADRLTPVGTSGPQTWMAMSPERYANAATIVHQALDKKMGIRSAVIAVATAMQESTLLNINYGDRDSLGLFQQRPSCGWGSASQILHPAYAADAFLSALHHYQAANPAWAHEPLWQTAQGVQASGFPTAYAKWEAQAASLVGSVTRHIY
jgi:hypothetical protein